MFLAAAYCYGREETLHPCCSVLVLTAIGIAALVCLLNVLWTVRCPERLQSEVYQILTAALRFLDRKTDAVKMRPDSISAILEAALAGIAHYRAPDKDQPDELGRLSSGGRV